MHTVKWWVRDRDAASPAPEPEPEATVDLESLSKAELAALAESKKLDPSGTKADLVERLTDG